MALRLVSCSSYTRIEVWVKLLAIYVDYRLNFGKHISEICRKAVSQLSVLKGQKGFVAFDVKKILAQSSIYSNFDYYPLASYFSSANSVRNMLLDITYLLNSDRP